MEIYICKRTVGINKNFPVDWENGISPLSYINPITNNRYGAENKPRFLIVFRFKKDAIAYCKMRGNKYSVYEYNILNNFFQDTVSDKILSSGTTSSYQNQSPLTKSFKPLTGN